LVGAISTIFSFFFVVVPLSWAMVHRSDRLLNNNNNNKPINTKNQKTNNTNAQEAGIGVSSGQELSIRVKYGARSHCSASGRH
jgi:hypothetical protein